MVMIIFVLWNRKFNYYNEQCLSQQGKHKLEVVLFFGAKRMKSKTKDTDVEI
jgi:hypothetical protein